MQAKTVSQSSADPFIDVIVPLMIVVFSGFLIIGVALPVLSRYVHDDLGFGTFAVGLVTGTQFAASLASRFHAGDYADRNGGKRAIFVGLLAAAVGGLVYLLPLGFQTKPVLSITIILIGRAVLGAAESFIITGAMSVGLALSGPKQTGRVIAWVGTAMFAAFALGAPLGTFVYDGYGFLWIALTTVWMPLVSVALLARLRRQTGSDDEKGSIAKTLGAVWLPGLGAAFNGVGLAALLTFSGLLFSERGWAMTWLPVTCFALALIAARLLLGQLIDRSGGVRMGMLFSLVTAAGQCLLWMAPAAWIAAAGASLTGVGWAMVYPAFGAEAVHRAASQNRGLAMGAYSTFPDLAIGLSSPLLGLIAQSAPLHSVYFASTSVALLSVPVSLFLQRAARRR